MNKFVLFGVGLLCAAAPARDEVSREYSKTVPWRAGQAVTIANKHGDVVVRGVAGSKEVSFRAFVRVSANTRAEAEQFSNGIQFDVTEGISFRTRYPERRSVEGFFERLFKSQHLGYSVRVEVLAPEGAALDVENAFGRVEVDSLRAGVTVRNDNGAIDVRKTAGLLRLTTKFSEARVSRNDGDVSVTNDNGAVSVADVKGSVTTRTRFAATEIERASGDVNATGDNGAVRVMDVGGVVRIGTAFGAVTAVRLKSGVTIKNDNGAIDLSDVSGSADLTTRFGPIKVANVAGVLVARNDNGEVAVSKIGAAATVRTKFGAAKLNDIGGDAVVENDNGVIELSGTRGTARLTTRFGHIRARDVAKAVSAENDNGEIRVSGALAGVTAKTKFGAIKLDAVGGAMELTNDNGAIEVAKVTGTGCEPLAASTRFGPIRITIPENSNYDLTARTQFGKIQSKFPLTIEGRDERPSANGKIGRGGCPMRLTNDNGSIALNP